MDTKQQREIIEFWNENAFLGYITDSISGIKHILKENKEYYKSFKDMILYHQSQYKEEKLDYNLIDDIKNLGYSLDELDKILS